MNKFLLVSSIVGLCVLMFMACDHPQNGINTTTAVDSVKSKSLQIEDTVTFYYNSIAACDPIVASELLVQHKIHVVSVNCVLDSTQTKVNDNAAPVIHQRLGHSVFKYIEKRQIQKI